MSFRKETVVPRVDSSLSRVLAASRNVSAPRNDRPDVPEPDLLITTGTFEATGADGGTMMLAYVQAHDVTYQDDSVYNTTKFVTPFDHGHEVLRSLPTIVNRQHVAALPDTKTEVREGVLYYRQQTKVTGYAERAIGAGIGLFWSLENPPPMVAQPPVPAWTLKDVLLRLLDAAYASASVRVKVKMDANVSFASAPEIWNQPADPPLVEPSFLGEIRLPQ